MKTYATRIDLPDSARTAIIALLNQQLADTFDLYTQIKQAHWNVKGMHFIALHELFDKFASSTLEHVDEIAERATSLGGIAVGTARTSARDSRLPEFPIEGIGGHAAVEALADRFALLAASTRKSIELSASLGDADTSDLFTGISRELDKNLWFLEAHLQG